MLDPASIATDRTIWAVPDAPQGTAGTGSRESPLRLGGNLDAVAGLLGASARLNLLPGVYSTLGLLHPATFVVDAPLGEVTWRLPNNAIKALNYPHVRMLQAKDGWASFVSVTGVVFDGNWSNQPGIQSKNFKIEPVVLQSLQAVVKGCTVRNWGSVGDPATKYFLETFPLSVTTLASGDPGKYLGIYIGLQNSERTPTRAEIIGNLVELPNFVGGGYCTGIFVRTNMGVSAGDRQPMGTRTTDAALVRGNRVIVPGGICYGAGGTKENQGTLGDWGVERTVFEDNDAEGKCELNIDSGRLIDVVYRNNRSRVSQGPNVTPDVEGDRLEFSGNTINIGEPFQNPILGHAEAQWGIRCQRVKNIKCTDNTIIVPPGFNGQVFDGFQPGPGNVTVQSGSDSAALNEAVAQVKTLIAELDEARKDILETTVEVRKLDARNIELKQRLASAADILTRP